jgi:hypothetical protein
LSVIRNDFPWIYDGALETFEKIKKSKTEGSARKAVDEFMRIVELTFEHPIMRDIASDNMFNSRSYRELPRIIYDLMRRYIEEKDIVNK